MNTQNLIFKNIDISKENDYVLFSFKITKDVTFDSPVGLYGFSGGAINVTQGSLKLNVKNNLIQLPNPNFSKFYWDNPLFFSLYTEGEDVEFEIEYSLTNASNYMLNSCLNFDDLENKGQKGAEAAMSYILGHTIEKFSVEELAKKSLVSTGYLMRSFKQSYGLTPFTFLKVIRCHLALEHILANKKHGASIAAHCGFYDQSHMIKSFKSVFSIVPRDIKNIRNQFNIELNHSYSNKLSCNHLNASFK
jgi:AraC-like DNA-binding protein